MKKTLLILLCLLVFLYVLNPFNLRECFQNNTKTQSNNTVLLEAENEINNDKDKEKEDSSFIQNTIRVLITNAEGGYYWRADEIFNNKELNEYPGNIYVVSEDSGYLVINVVPLEEYLIYVTASEMPSSFEMEALKAQAICARTYAVRQIMNSRLDDYYADVDDTAAFQVYSCKNYSKSVKQAVEETSGIILTYKNEPIEAFYYSCSGGMGTTPAVWSNYKNENNNAIDSGDINGDEINSGEINGNKINSGEINDNEINSGEINDNEINVYEINVYEINTNETNNSEKSNNENTNNESNADNDYPYLQAKVYGTLEEHSPWYRWSYYAPALDIDCMKEKILWKYHNVQDKVSVYNQSGEQVNNKEQEDFLSSDYIVRDMKIEEYQNGAIARVLIIYSDLYNIKIYGENNIRYVLGDSNQTLICQDGSKHQMDLLPSGYFQMYCTYR